MRKVIYSMMTSLDGFIARPNGDLDWVTMSEELHTFANEQQKQVDTNLYGRRMYEVMAAYWPTADKNPDAHDVEIEYARLWQQAEKIVISTTLKQVEGNARIVRDNIADEVNALKARPGKGISIGGADIAATFMHLGLIDAYHIYLHPVILGEGIPMFPTPETTRHLQLVESRTFASGVLFLHYEPTNLE